MNTRFCLLTAAAALLTGICALAQGPSGIPDPKTVFDIPEHWYECPLGLPGPFPRSHLLPYVGFRAT